MKKNKINLYLGLKHLIYLHKMLRKKQEDCLEILTNQKMNKFRKFPKIRKKIAQLSQKHLYLVVSLQVGYLELLKKIKLLKQRIWTLSSLNHKRIKKNKINKILFLDLMQLDSLDNNLIIKKLKNKQKKVNKIVYSELQMLIHPYSITKIPKTLIPH